MLDVQGAERNRPAKSLRERADEFPSIAPWAHGDAGFDARDASAFPEIDCVRDLLPPDLIAAAEARARAIGVGADRVLIASGALTEEIFVRSLAPDLGLPFETLENVGRARCPLNDERLIESVAAGILPLTMDDEIALVVAPRDARHLMAAMQSSPILAQRFRLTTAEQLNKFVFNYGNATLGERAARALHVRWPKLSAAPPRWRANLRFGGVTALVALSIDNTADSWLAGIFTAEYAGQFDVFLPGIAALRLPLPLGGSSNHFRGIRQQTHLWYKYNT